MKKIVQKSYYIVNFNETNNHDHYHDNKKILKQKVT